MSVGERMLRIIERVGILVATTFDSFQNDTMNRNFDYSHIGMFVVTYITCIHITNIVLLFGQAWEGSTLTVVFVQCRENKENLAQ